MTDRIKLIVTEVQEPKSVGDKGAKKLEFQAKNPEGKELPYFTFRPTLFENIKPGAELDAGVDIKTREVKGNTYIDRQVQELYVDNQPIVKKGGFAPWHDDSPEKRRSIERQTSLQIAAQMSEPTDSVDELLSKAERIYKWLSEGKKAETINKASPGEQEGQGTDQQVESAKPAKVEAPVNVGIDMDWLSGVLKKIKWSDTTAKSWLKAQFKGTTDQPLVNMIKALTAEQKQLFVDHLKSLEEVS